MLRQKQVHGFDICLGCKPCAIRPFGGQQQVHTLTSSGARDSTGLVERQQYLLQASFVEAHFEMHQVCIYIYSTVYGTNQVVKYGKLLLKHPPSRGPWVK